MDANEEPNKLALGAMLAVFGVVLIVFAFGMTTGDAMFGGLTQKAPLAILGVILFIPGVAKVIRELRDRAKIAKREKMLSTPDGRRTVVAGVLTEIDQQLAKAESLAGDAGDDEKLKRAQNALNELREFRSEVERKPKGE